MNLKRVVQLLKDVDTYIGNLDTDDLERLNSSIVEHEGHNLISSDTLSVMNNELGNDLLMLEIIAPAIFLDDRGFLPGHLKLLESNNIDVVRSNGSNLYQYYLLCDHFTFGVGFK